MLVKTRSWVSSPKGWAYFIITQIPQPVCSQPSQQEKPYLGNKEYWIEEGRYTADFLPSAPLTFGDDNSLLLGYVLYIRGYLVASLCPPDAGSTLPFMTTKNDTAK